jgi:hypothetical protein
MTRPPRDDELARFHFWCESLSRSREDVVRNAASALALRDARIVQLERQLQEALLPRRER